MDGLGPEEKDDGDVLRDIEAKTFKLIKKEISKEDEWTGTAKQNGDGDLKVAKTIRRSFYVYEKSKQSYMPSFFKFK